MTSAAIPAGVLWDKCGPADPSSGVGGWLDWRAELKDKETVSSHDPIQSLRRMQLVIFDPSQDLVLGF